MNVMLKAIGATRRLRFVALFLIVCFSQPRMIQCASAADSLATNSKSHSLQNWIQSRCNHGKHGMWAYEGTLYDPMTGQPIAAVEGLELIRRLSRPLIAAPSNAESVIIRRLFAYRDLQKEKGWLRSFRLRPTSPKRIIPLDQAATVYDLAVTFVPDPNNENSDSKWYIHAEWPNGQSLWSSALVDSSKESLRFTTFTRPSSNQKESALPPWQRNNQTLSSSSSSRRQLIQFSGNNVQEKRFGAQETYRYTFGAQTSTTVDYTRYGEGPVWYGRYCTLQLKGRPCQEIPPSLLSLSQRIPGFWSMHGPVEDDNQVMQSFSKGALVTRITEEDDLPQSHWKRRVLTWTERIRKSSVWMDRIPSRME